jgi:hypothetical protein
VTRICSTPDPLAQLQCIGPFHELGPLGPFFCCYNHPLRIRRSRRIPDRLILSGHLIQDPPLLPRLCVPIPARVPCHAVSTMGPCTCTHHARASDLHVPVKPRESALIPNVTSSPGIHGPGPLCREWSHLRSNPLELSSSLRSKRLIECYYVSLALIFKSMKLLRIRIMLLNTGAQCFAVLQ